MKKILSLLLLVSLSAKGQNYFSDKIALSNAVYGVAATVVKERGASGSTAAALAMLSNEATSGYKTSRLIEELKREHFGTTACFCRCLGAGNFDVYLGGVACANIIAPTACSRLKPARKSRSTPTAAGP